MSKPISELPKTMGNFFKDLRDVMFETADAIRVRMAETGDPSTSPVQWDGEQDPRLHTTKQQRAYFASDGFGAGIPYRRIGAYEASWTVERQPLGTTLHAPHPAGAIGGLPGGWQSNIHRGRWNNLTQVLFDELGKLPDAITNAFETRFRQ